MAAVIELTRRNVKLFFKDKGMFFTALITPGILLALYATFLGGIYRDSFIAAIPAGITLPDRLVDGLVGGQLVASILAVSSVTVAFCSNFLMVQDKANGTARDFRITPVKPYALSIGYFAATLISTLITCFGAAALCFVYLAVVGWYLSFLDVLLLLADITLLVTFGTALSSVISFFLSTQGQISAVGTVISAGYGFICGAYMPLSAFSEGLRRVIGFLPGTYATSLIRNHAMGGAIDEMAGMVPAEVTDAIRVSVDCDLYFFDTLVPTSVMYLILTLGVLVLGGAYVVMNVLRSKKAK